MKAQHNSRLTRELLCGLLLTAIVAGWTNAAQAMSLEEFNNLRDLIRQQSKSGVLDPDTEADMINSAWQEYIQQHAFLPSLGQPQLDGAYPVSREDMGVSGRVTFGFVDPSTGLPTDGPAVDFVVYDVNLDPDTPDDYMPIGASSDAASDFAVDWVLSSFEPAIRATPYDDAGNPVVIPGVGGYNVAVGSVTDIPIPEPATIALLALGGAGALHRRRVVRV